MVLKLGDGVCIYMEKFIDEIQNKIEQAKVRSGRGDDEILLVAVSKTQPFSRILEAQSFGLNVFGENKVQELVEKYPYINNVRWHLIGHLQKNKVKYIIDKVDMIHSVDSLALAAEINKRSQEIGRKTPILVQINIGKEESKSGIYEEDVNSFLEGISIYDNLIVSGIMTVPPAKASEEITRKYFKKMKSIFTAIKNLGYKNFDIKYLSMGMTDDFEIAIEEGANIIRVGTGIFGQRVYKEE